MVADHTGWLLAAAVISQEMMTGYDSIRLIFDTDAINNAFGETQYKFKIQIQGNYVISQICFQ